MRKKDWKVKRPPEKAIPPSERVIEDPAKARERTMQRAIKMLAAKPRSTMQLTERLLEKNWTNEEIVKSVIEKLQEYGYLDDEKYAFGYASYQVRQKPVGRQRLQRSLATRKVDKQVAEEAIRLVYEENPETDLIDRAIDKRLRLRGRPTSRKETKSLFDHLLRLGFSYDLVIRKVREVSSAETLDESDEPS